MNLFQVMVLRILFRFLLKDQLGESEDHLKEVVEIMGNTARQSPYGFHFLGFTQLIPQRGSLRLCSFELGKVQVHTIHFLAAT